MEIFSVQLLQAICDWQSGGDESQVKRRGKVLKSACASLPAEFRTCDVTCYRQIALAKGGVWKLIAENHLPEKISSWTCDIEVAQSFKGGVPPQGQGFQGAIFYLRPHPDSVVVNLWNLYQNAAFNAAIESNKSQIKGFHNGIGRYGNTQNEIVLEIDVVSEENVLSLGGYSSPLDELVATAAEAVYGRPATIEERSTLLLKAQQAGVSSGPRWLNEAATRRVLAKTKPQANELAIIKLLLQQKGQ